MSRKARRLVIYGDSISTGTHGEGGYEALLRESLGIEETKNYAVGSSGLSYRTPNNGASILECPDKQPVDAQIVLVWHGSNDWYWGSPIGSLTDSTAHTFLGAIGECVAKIREASPEALLVWVNPIYRYELPFEGKAAGKAYGTPNREGLTLLYYCNAIEQAGKYHGFPVIDMHGLCGIHERNQEHYLEDMVHPNKAGYQRIHRVLDRKIKELLPLWGFENPGCGEEKI